MKEDKRKNEHKRSSLDENCNVKYKEIKSYLEKQYDMNNNLKAILSKVRKEEFMEKSKILKMVATFILAIGITAGVVFAGGIVYEKVFKKPEKIGNYIEELKVNQEDLNSIISETEAIKNAKEQAERFGITINENEIEKIELIKEPNYDSITYNILTNEKNGINIDAKTGKITGFYRNINNKNNELEKYTTTKENIIKEAEKKLKEYGFSDEYKLAEISSNYENENEAYLWYIRFAKEYDGLFNMDESISMTIIPQINLVEKLTINDEPFDNNPIVISEEEAINTAKEKDKVINTEGYTVKEIKSELAIKNITPDVYLKENGLDNGNETSVLEDGSTYSYNTYKMNGKARKVYVVEIIYENRPFGQTRKYYVDTTTNEVIGGEDIFDLMSYGGEDILNEE